MTVAVDVEDLRVVIAELDRSGAPGPSVLAAADRLRHAIAPTLFGPSLSDPAAATAGAAHASGRDTERAAAWAAMPRAGTQRRRVLDALAASNTGLTDHEIAGETGLYLYSAAPRRVELLRGGWLRDSGHRRRTPHGSDAVVWALTEAGLDRLETMKETTP